MDFQQEKGFWEALSWSGICPFLTRVKMYCIVYLTRLSSFHCRDNSMCKHNDHPSPFHRWELRLSRWSCVPKQGPGVWTRSWLQSLGLLPLYFAVSQKVESTNSTLCPTQEVHTDGSKEFMACGKSQSPGSTHGVCAYSSKCRHREGQFSGTTMNPTQPRLALNIRD
jgi:hypothetical protein